MRERNAGQGPSRSALQAPIRSFGSGDGLLLIERDEAVQRFVQVPGPAERHLGEFEACAIAPLKSLAQFAQ